MRTESSTLAVLPPIVTTWALVRMYPSLVSTTPEPLPPDPEPETLMVTTDGDAAEEAAVTQLTSSRLLTTMAGGLVR